MKSNWNIPPNYLRSRPAVKTFPVASKTTTLTVSWVSKEVKILSSSSKNLGFMAFMAFGRIRVTLAIVALFR